MWAKVLKTSKAWQFSSFVISQTEDVPRIYWRFFDEAKHSLMILRKDLPVLGRHAGPLSNFKIPTAG
jgi:hypothetical protein